jgi:hypothetical protein
MSSYKATKKFELFGEQISHLATLSVRQKSANVRGTRQQRLRIMTAGLPDASHQRKSCLRLFLHASSFVSVVSVSIVSRFFCHSMTLLHVLLCYRCHTFHMCHRLQFIFCARLKISKVICPFCLWPTAKYELKPATHRKV